MGTTKHGEGAAASNDHGGHAMHEEQHGHGSAGHAMTAARDGHEGHEAHGAHGGHDMHAGHDMQHMSGGGHMHHVAMFRRLFWRMLAIAVPVVALDPMFAHLLGYRVPTSGVISWIPVVLGTVMYVWGGRPFLTGAVSEAKSHRPGMMMLISLGITVAFVASWLSVLGVTGSDLAFWWELALLIVIMLLGHWVEMASLARTSSAVDSLASLLPDEAIRVDEDGSTEQVAPDQLATGDIVLVRPGASVPADGTVVDGTAHLDESMITGESKPVSRTTGDDVVAGTVSTDSPIKVKVTATGDDTALAGIQRLVESAQSSKSRTQVLADRAAAWLFWYALGAAVITAIVWLVVGTPATALERVITVLVIACPHALGLAIPLVVSIASERAAAAGVLITDRRTLEAMRTIDLVLFDKTGTLTEGEPAVTGILAPGDDEDRVLAFAAAAESESEHPLARAILAAAKDRKLDVPRPSGSSSTPGVGVSARVDGQEVAVGGPQLLQEHHAQPLGGTRAWEEQGATVLHVLADDRVIGALRVADEIRPQSKQAVQELHERGIAVGMITGDSKAVADAVAAELGIDRVWAGVRPEQKAERVRDAQQEGQKVAMVGDGVNDAPALAQADAGIAIGAGTDVAIASAGIVLAGDDPRLVSSVVDLSKRSMRLMIENLWWAAGYNLIAVPLAAGILAPIGFMMPMSIGAILMSVSTVVVALNAQRLRRIDLKPGPVDMAEKAAPEVPAAR